MLPGPVSSRKAHEEADCAYGSDGNDRDSDEHAEHEDNKRFVDTEKLDHDEEPNMNDRESGLEVN